MVRDLRVDKADGGIRRAKRLRAVTPTEDGAATDDESFFAAVAAVTAAFGDTTRRSIYAYLRETDGVTAGEIAKRFDLHPNVARHHLDRLAAGGYLEVSIEHAPAGAGRPSKRYRRSARSAALSVPPRPDELVVALLVRALSLLDPDTATEMAEEVGESYGRNLAAQMAPGEGQRSMHAAMLAVADALTAHGFAAHGEHTAETSSIVRDYCPFGTAAIEYPVLCAVDRGMVKGLFAGLCGDDVVISLSSRALGDEACESIVV